MLSIHAARSVAAALACVLLIGSASGGDLPREITSQYRPAVEKLRQAYTHATVEGTVAVAYPTRGKSRVQEFAMRANGQKRRLDVKTTAQQGLGLKLGSTQMRMATPYGSLVTTATPGAEAFDDATETGYAETVAQIDNRSLLNFPYALDSNGTILDMLLSPGVKVTGVERINAEGRPLVQINYEETSRHEGHSGLWKTQLILAPDEGWPLVSFTRTLSQGSHELTQRARLAYSGNAGGIPLVESIEFESTEGRTLLRQESVKVSNFKLGDPDEYYFSSFSF
jgi:hypothetical protein